MVPMKTHMAWRWNTTHELPKSRRACTDDADSTITSPTTTRALTSIASRTKSGVAREGAFLVRFAHRVERQRARGALLAVGTAVPLEQLTNRTAEVVTALRVGPVP